MTDFLESITDVLANLDSKPKAMKVQLLALVHPSAPRDEPDVFFLRKKDGLLYFRCSAAIGMRKTRREKRELCLHCYTSNVVS